MPWIRESLKTIAPPVPSKLRFGRDDIVWHLTLDQIESHTGRIVNKRFAPAETASSSTLVFDESNVLYSKLRPYLNKVVCPTESGIATTELIPLKPNGKIIDRKYLTYFLRSQEFLDFATATVAGVKMPRIIMKKFWDFEVPIPPPSEQLRIVAILNQAEELRQKRREAEAAADCVLPALFYEMFGDPITNSRAWGTDQLGNTVESITYGLGEQLSLTETKESGTPIVRISNVQITGELDLSDMRYSRSDRELVSRINLQNGDLLFNWRNGSAEHIGKTAIWEGQLDEAIFVSFLLRIRCGNRGMRPLFLWALLKYLREAGFFSRVSRMQINRKFNATELYRLTVIVPPEDLQEKFERKVALLRSLRKMRSKSWLDIEHLNSVLFDRAFDGNLTVRWREAHMAELLQEMDRVRRYLDSIDRKFKTSV